MGDQNSASLTHLGRENDHGGCRCTVKTTKVCKEVRGRQRLLADGRIGFQASAGLHNQHFWYLSHGG